MVWLDPEGDAATTAPIAGGGSALDVSRCRFSGWRRILNGQHPLIARPLDAEAQLRIGSAHAVEPVLVTLNHDHNVDVGVFAAHGLSLLHPGRARRAASRHNRDRDDGHQRAEAAPALHVSLLGDSLTQSGPGQKASRVERRQRTVAIVEDDRQLSAAEDDRVAAAVTQAIDHGAQAIRASGTEPVRHQFLHALTGEILLRQDCCVFRPACAVWVTF